MSGVVTGTSGQVAVVTGAGHGIGRASAERLATDGYVVVIAEIDPERAARTVAAIEETGGVATSVATDVADAASVEAMVAATVAQHGRLDVLVNNAGIGHPARLHELALDDWHRVIETTLSSVFYAVRAAVPHMIDAGGGRIINIASVQGLVAHRRNGAYNAAKGGVVNLTRAIALDYATDNIRCNCICPGAVETQGREARAAGLAGGSFAYPQAQTLDEVDAMHPLGRIGTPQEIAAAVSFLASPDSSFVTGAALVADGGLTVQVLA